jgi:hypothetical protein
VKALAISGMVKDNVSLPDAYGYITPDWFLSTLFTKNQHDQNLAQFLFKEPVIVIEQSPCALTDLTSFLQKATGVSIGAYMGMTAATSLGNPLLMFITAPLGMLIMGTASGVGAALEQGLRDKVLGWLKEKKPPALDHASRRRSRPLRLHDQLVGRRPR